LFNEEFREMLKLHEIRASAMAEAQSYKPEIGQDFTDWIGMDDPANSIESLTKDNVGPFKVTKHAGDPFGCDNAAMRAAKLKSKYAWVSLRDRYGLQG
jgi:hypothetical protein